YEEKQIEDKDLAFLALDKLMQYLLSHKGQISLFSRNSIGYLEGNYVCIYREKLKHILNNLDFEDHEIIIKSWIDSGIIQSSENDRITTRKVKDGKRFISYKIKIPEEYKAVLTKEFHKNGHTFRAY
ncbi:hypothetical protein, partial [Salmonella enterica]|uniref:hypothetical protein n=1 Tax=Salmonella enterica TaxID=28901 RepID=UPI000CAAC735